MLSGPIPHFDGDREEFLEAIHNALYASKIISYAQGYALLRSAANLLQAQRDYFGAHTYERVDSPRGEFFHTNWTGEGGSTSSSGYIV